MYLKQTYPSVFNYTFVNCVVITIFKEYLRPYSALDFNKIVISVVTKGVNFIVVSIENISMLSMISLIILLA